MQEKQKNRLKISQLKETFFTQAKIPSSIQSIKGYSAIAWNNQNFLLLYDQKYFYISSWHHKGGKYSSHQIPNIKKIISIYANFILMVKQKGQIGVFQININGLTQFQLKPIKQFTKAESYFLRQIKQQLYQLQIFLSTTEFCSYQFSKKQGQIGFLSYTIDQYLNIIKTTDMGLYGTKDFYSQKQGVIIHIQNQKSVSKLKVNLSPQRQNFIIGSSNQQKYLKISISSNGLIYLQQVNSPNDEMIFPIKIARTQIFTYYNLLMIRSTKQTLVIKVQNCKTASLIAVIQGISYNNSWISPCQIGTLLEKKAEKKTTLKIRIYGFNCPSNPPQLNMIYAKSVQQKSVDQQGKGQIPIPFKPYKVIGRKKVNVSKSYLNDKEQNVKQQQKKIDQEIQLIEQQKKPKPIQKTYSAQQKMKQFIEIEESHQKMIQIQKKIQNFLNSKSQTLYDLQKENQQEEQLIRDKIKSHQASYNNEANKYSISFADECKLPPKVQNVQVTVNKQKQVQKNIEDQEQCQEEKQYRDFVQKFYQQLLNKDQEKQNLNQIVHKLVKQSLTNSESIVKDIFLKQLNSGSVQLVTLQQFLKDIKETNNAQIIFLENSFLKFQDNAKQLNKMIDTNIHKLNNLHKSEKQAIKAKNQVLKDCIIENTKKNITQFMIKEGVNEIQKQTKNIFKLEENFYKEVTKQLQKSTQKHSKIVTNLINSKNFMVNEYENLTNKVINEVDQKHWNIQISNKDKLSEFIYNETQLMSEIIDNTVIKIKSANNNFQSTRRQKFRSMIKGLQNMNQKLKMKINSQSSVEEKI